MKGRMSKTLVVIILLACMTVNMCIPTMAVSYIKDITIVVENNGEAYPIIYVYDSKCYMSENISWNREEDTLSVGDKVRGLLTIAPCGGYWFKKGSKITVNLIGSGAASSTSTYLVTAEDECKVLVTYTVEGRPETPDDAYWSDSDPWNANVSRVNNATGYEFVLYKEGVILAEKTTVEPKVDFSEELSKYGTCENNYVYFEARATRGKNKSKYAQSYYFNDWDSLKELCKKVGNRTWKWRESKTEEVLPPKGSNNTGTLFPPPPGA